MSASGSEEIEQTLRIERDRVERRIAHFRVWFFGFIVISGPLFATIGHLLGKPPINPVPGLTLYGLCLTYALALRSYVDRVGARPWILYGAVVLDLMAILAPGVVFPHFDPVVAQQRAMFAAHLTAPGVLLVLGVNTLRMNPRVTIFCGVLGLALGAASLVMAEGVQPPLVGILIAIGFLTAIGATTARQTRRSLETFARMQLLRRYLPPAAVERVLQQRPDDALALGGRLTTITLIAADLRGFTRMSEKLPPEAVVEQLNEFHGRMLEQIERHGGALDKFIGDGILAVFGMEASSPDAGANQAVACAGGMLQALESLNRERQSRALSALAMGIGVHTGPVVAGNIGAPGKRLEFTVIGDTVNTTARLEGLTKEAGRSLLISSATAERLGSDAPLEALPAMAVRGRELPLEVFGLKQA